MTNLPIPLQVLYAGLAGTVLALIVATIQNRWSLRVFFLLALRLAIGWHFLFEGLGKIHSHYVGQTETNRPFTSEPYFKEADGPIAPYMRKQIGDPDEQMKARTYPASTPEALARIDDPNLRRLFNPASIPDEQYVKSVPEQIRKEWDAFAQAFSEKYKLPDDDKKRFDGTLDDQEKQELADKKGPGDLTIAAMVKYGKWIVGVEPRDSKLKFVSGATPLTAPQRLEYIKKRQAELEDLQKRPNANLGNGYGYDMARIKEAKTVISLARTALITDADAFLSELKADAFATVRDNRFTRTAPKPSEVIGKDQKFFEEWIAIPAQVPNPVAFDALPPTMKLTWDRFFSAFNGFYPEAQAGGAYSTAQARLANWYFDLDEFTSTPKAGFGALVKAYRTKSGLRDGITATFVRATAPGSDSSAFINLFLAAAKDKTDADAKAAHEAVLKALDDKYADLNRFLTAAIPVEMAKGPIETPEDKSAIEKLDWRTRWLITAIGAMLLLGLFTPVACLLGTGFLVLTYLTHPPFPWLPLPPGTEGTPVFVNKNVIEALGLLVIMVHPTGRWLGLDALWHKLIFRKAPDPR